MDFSLSFTLLAIFKQIIIFMRPSLEKTIFKSTVLIANLFHAFVHTKDKKQILYVVRADRFI